VSDLSDHGMAGAVGAAIVGAFAALKRAVGGRPELPPADPRVDRLETRLLAVETSLAASVAKLTAIAESQRETSVRQWQATEKLQESVDTLSGLVTAMTTEQALRRELSEKEE
jgi:hypothetical protein